MKQNATSDHMYSSYKVPTIIIVCSLLFFSGCLHQFSERQIGTPSTMPQPSQPPFPPEGLRSLTPKAVATLANLKKVDAYPLYVMHYIGDYDTPGETEVWSQESDISCSLFVSLGDKGNMIHGRNFDWGRSPALLLFTNPSDGYASISMVNLRFLDMDLSKVESLEEVPLRDRVELLNTPWLPIDGMNEYGLTVSMAAVHESVAGQDSAKKTVGSLSIIRLILDHARSVDEAVAIFEKHNIDFTEGPPIHYLIADPTGAAVLIEFCQGEMILLPNENPWHLATNHLRCIAVGDGGCQRYRTMAEKLAKTNGRLDMSAAMNLLSEVSQDSTQWSVVYGMTSGDVCVAMGRDFETILTFRLEEKQTAFSSVMPVISPATHH